MQDGKRKSAKDHSHGAPNVDEMVAQLSFEGFSTMEEVAFVDV